MTVLAPETSRGLPHWSVGDASQIPMAHRLDTSLPSAAPPLAPSAVRDGHQVAGKGQPCARLCANTDQSAESGRELRVSDER